MSRVRNAQRAASRSAVQTVLTRHPPAPAAPAAPAALAVIPAAPAPIGLPTTGGGR